jgi:hypothetical protein
LGDAGGVGAEEDAEQAVGDGEADALGLGGAGELGLLVRVEEDVVGLRLGQALLGPGQLLVQVVDLLAQLPDLVGGRGGAVDGGEDGVGLAVEALARDLALLGQRGDGAVGAEAGGGGAGEAAEGG